METITHDCKSCTTSRLAPTGSFTISTASSGFSRAISGRNRHSSVLHAVVAEGFSMEDVMVDSSAGHQIDDIITKADDWRGEKLSQLRAVIKAADLAVVE